MADTTLLSPSNNTGSRANSRNPQSSAGDEEAFELLLAFTRLARNAKHNEEIPSRLRTLVLEGALAPRHLTAFAIVAMHGPLSISQLARREGCATTTASLVATQLADAGLIERREDTLDRRRTVISITPAFRKDSRLVLEARLAPLRRAMKRMGPDRARIVSEGLAILAEEIE
jgi:DNA-binding MarR family transcriptional regulator